MLNFAQNSGSQAFHLLSVVEEQMELDTFRSRSRDLAQAYNASGGRTIHSNRAQARSPIDLLEGSINTSGTAIDSDVNSFGDGERCWFLVCFCQCRTQHVDLLGELCGGGTTSAKEPGAVANRCRVIAPNPERGIRLLKGVGFHRRVIKLPEATAEGDVRLGPTGLHQSHSFGEASDKAGGRGSMFTASPTSANSNLNTPTTELIQRADTFGEVDRVVQRADEDGSSQSASASWGEGHEVEPGQGAVPSTASCIKVL